MDEPNAFERQIQREVHRAFGPPRPVDVVAIVRDAARSATPNTRLRRRVRWWPFLGFRQRENAPAATHHQPSPTSLANGQTPTVIGRTASMFSPAKAVTAGALVFAIGGVMLIAQPFDQQQGSVPGAAADVEPVAFTARFMPGTQVRMETYEAAAGQPDTGGRMERRGAAWAPIILEASDRRLQGAMTVSNDEDHYPGADGPESFVAGTSTYRIVTEEGAWQGSVPYFCAPECTSAISLILVGEGTYDGFYAIADVSDWQAVSGVIFPASPPPAPVPPETE